MDYGRLGPHPIDRGFSGSRTKKDLDPGILRLNEHDHRQLLGQGVQSTSYLFVRTGRG